MITKGASRFGTVTALLVLTFSLSGYASADNSKVAKDVEKCLKGAMKEEEKNKKPKAHKIINACSEELDALDQLLSTMNDEAAKLEIMNSISIGPKVELRSYN